MATLRAKMRCLETAVVWNGDGTYGHTARLRPVISGSPENDAFYRWTPGGSVELTTLRSGAFQVGQDYYVDFTPCVDAAPGAEVTS